MAFQVTESNQKDWKYSLDVNSLALLPIHMYLHSGGPPSPGASQARILVATQRNAIEWERVVPFDTIGRSEWQALSDEWAGLVQLGMLDEEVLVKEKLIARLREF